MTRGATHLLTLGALAFVVGALLSASPAAAAAFLVRTKGAQMDEAVAALKSELGQTPSEIVVDEATSAAAIVERVGAADVVIAVGARAATLALQQPKAPVVHCMVLQDAGSFDTEHSAGVPLAVPAQKRLETLKRLDPSVKRVGVLYDPKLNARAVAELERAARALSMSIVPGSVTSSTGAPAAFDAIAGKIDALIVIPDATVVTKPFVTFLVANAFDKRMPVLAFSDALAKVGLLAALAPSYAQNGKLCAKLAKRVLAGESIGALHDAVEMNGALVVNAATARRIGVTLSPDVLKPPTIVVGE